MNRADLKVGMWVKASGLRVTYWKVMNVDEPYKFYIKAIENYTSSIETDEFLKYYRPVTTIEKIFYIKEWI